MASPDGALIAPLAQAVHEAVAGHPDVRRVIVALGGGADSACLLAAARAGFDGDVSGVFVDHDLPQSASLEEAAIAVGRVLDVRVSVLPARVPDGPDLERRARDVRYAAIEQMADPDALFLTGHTSDDQAETVLMRLADGAGTTGLSGIPATRGRWARPLLAFTKADLRRTAEGLELPYADDPANRDDRHTRSRVRHRVVPVLEAELGAHAREGMARSASLLARDDAVLDAIAEAIPLLVIDEAVEIPVARLVTESEAVASRACRKALRIAGDGYPGTSSDVEAILDVARTGATHSLSGGLLAVRVGPHVRVGSIRVPDPVSLSAGEPVTWGSAVYRLHREFDRPVLTGGRFTALDADAVAAGILLRGARDGDRIDIGIGSTPVVEVLRSHGVPSADRPVSPVVVIDGKIGAVVGVRTAAWAAPSDRRRRVIIEREVGT